MAQPCCTARTTASRVTVRVKTIVHIIETGGPGGAETVFMDIIRSLDPTIWRSVAVIPDPGWLNDELLKSGIETCIISERVSFDPVFFGRLVRLIRRAKADLIHGHLLGSSVRSALLSVATGVPAIGTLHGQTDIAVNEGYRGMKIAALQRLKKLVFVSEQLRESFAEIAPLPDSLARVIPNGIDSRRFDGRFPAHIRQEFGILPSEFLIGAVGNPGPAKGYEVLLDAASLLKHRSPGCRFVVVGETSNGRGDELAAGRRARGLEEEVIFTGFRSDVAPILAALDLYLLPSLSEGFSLSLVEAMAAGRAIIATRCGGPEGIIEDQVSGVLVAVNSASSIANAVVELRNNPELRMKLGSAARSAASERYTIAAQVAAYEDLYLECIGSGAGGSYPLRGKPSRSIGSGHAS